MSAAEVRRRIRLRSGIAAYARAGACPGFQPFCGVECHHVSVCAHTRDIQRGASHGAAAGWSFRRGRSYRPADFVSRRDGFFAYGIDSRPNCAANPLSLPAFPPGVTGIFESHVVAVDAESGAVVGATIGGWSCSNPGPTQFDGSYVLERLPVGRDYEVYVEPFNGAVDPSQVGNATASLCRNATSDAGWPAQQSCVVPAADISFTTRTRPGP
jgi:hypothetical protein